jgi:hypothetical protein
MSRLSIVLWSLLVFVLIATAAGFWLNRPRRIGVDAPLPDNFPEAGFSHQVFQDLLQEYVSPDGRVDYARWHASAESRGALDSYLAAVSRFGPESTPERFSSRNSKLAYWMYAYNAWVIKAVLLNWPLSSVELAVNQRYGCQSTAGSHQGHGLLFPAEISVRRHLS